MKTRMEDAVEAMSATQVVEAAEMVLPDMLGIDDLENIAAEAAAIAGLDKAQAKELDSLMRDAAASSRNEITELLRLVLAHAAETPGDSGEQVRKKLSNVGKKQIVIGPELLYLGAFLVICYIGAVRGGKTGEDVKITVEEMKDGRKKVTIAKKTTYLNPLNPIAGVLEKFLGKKA